MVNVGRVYQAKRGFVTEVEGRRLVVTPGMVVRESDWFYPFLKPLLTEERGFKLLSDVTDDNVERATAAPGEKHSVPSRPQPREKVRVRDVDEENRCDHPGCGRTFGTPAALGSHRRVHEDV